MVSIISVESHEAIVADSSTQTGFDFEAVAKLADFPTPCLKVRKAQSNRPKIASPVPASWALGGFSMNLEYTVQEDNSDADSAAGGENAVRLCCGNIEDAAGNDTVRIHNAVADDAS